MKRIRKVLFGLSCVALLAACQPGSKEISIEEAKKRVDEIIERSEQDDFDKDVDFVMDVNAVITESKTLDDVTYYDRQTSNGRYEISISDKIGYQNMHSTHELINAPEGVAPEADSDDIIYAYVEKETIETGEKDYFYNVNAVNKTYSKSEIYDTDPVDYFKSRMQWWILFLPAPWNYEQLEEISEGMDELINGPKATTESSVDEDYDDALEPSESVETSESSVTSEPIPDYHIYSTGAGNLKIDLTMGEGAEKVSMIYEWNNYRISYGKIHLTQAALNPTAEPDENVYLTMEAHYSYKDVTIEKPDLTDYTAK